MVIDDRKEPFDVAGLASRITSRKIPGTRYILGLTGPPGTGKSTIVSALVNALASHCTAVAVPMDGFHLANSLIAGTAQQFRKGALDTFDAAGYAHLIGRLRRNDEAIVYAPQYDRRVEEPIAACIAVAQQVEVVITEGNYLLSQQSSWPIARALMDQVWYLETPETLRKKRLTARHVQFGKSATQADSWVRDSDEINAELVRADRHRADLILQGT